MRRKVVSQLRHQEATFRELGARVIFVIHGEAGGFRSLLPEPSDVLLGLPDSEGLIADLYGQEVMWTRGGRMRATFVIDGVGTLRFARYGESPFDLPDIETILDAVRESANGHR